MKPGCILLFFSLALAGCVDTNNTEIKVTLKTGDFLNPNIYNQSSPVVITFYQLKSATLFQQVNFYTLYENASKTLDSDLLDKYEIELQPQNTQQISFNLSPAANYIGVVAAFRQPDRAQWRQVISITPGKNVQLQTTVGAQSIIVIKK